MRVPSMTHLHVGRRPREGVPGGAGAAVDRTIDRRTSAVTARVRTGQGWSAWTTR
ncbi:hypothetical protein Ae168Ps1_3825 [Pseudonocardia sp. Ae168_Ps1]|nr:hypothetical protein Ae168Ps1_3825 [Pseudonocardia sp. Ae168_Ps1]